MSLKRFLIDIENPHWVGEDYGVVSELQCISLFFTRHRDAIKPGIANPNSG